MPGNARLFLTLTFHRKGINVQVHCRTNLDLCNERWPTELPAVPHVGDRIRSETKWGNFQLELKVVGVTWKKVTGIPGYRFDESDSEWIPEIELHDGWPVPRSISDFFEWYAPIVGRSVSSFI